VKMCYSQIAAVL